MLNKGKMSITYKISLKNRCKKIQKNDFLFIYEIIKSQNHAYSKNKNGVWINLHKLNDTFLWKIDSYLKTIETTNEIEVPKQSEVDDKKKTVVDDKKTVESQTLLQKVKKKNKTRQRNYDICKAFGVNMPVETEPDTNVLELLKNKKTSELSNYEKTIIKKSNYINRQVLFKNCKSMTASFL